MTHPNRVQPDGAFLAHASRGTLMGNRGILHDAEGRALPRRWAHQAWVCCELSFRGRKRTLRTAGRYTELFFLDEAVALAAGHRPCGECRRADYETFAGAWTRAFGDWPGPKEADAHLHAARAHPGARRLKHRQMPAEDLPDHAMFVTGGQTFLKHGGHAHPYAPAGYGPARPLPNGPVTALTSPVAQAILAAGYVPRLHPTLRAM